MLKTNCTGCIWKTLPTGCQLDKSLVFNDIDNKEYQFTPGYCRHKRMSKWATKNIDSTISTGNEVLNIINEEESKISYLVTVINDDLTGLKQTINSLLELKETAVHLIISTQFEDESILKTIVQLLNESKFKWDLDNITSEEEIDPVMMINYGSRLVNTHWFMSIVDGDIITKNIVDQISSYMDLTQANFVGFYFDVNDDLRFVANTYAFREMGGNAFDPWLSKIRKFEGWENTCLQLTK